MLKEFIRYIRVKLSSPMEYQTFTYFIPSPPLRRNGYREKEIDGLFQQLKELGFALIDYKTQALNFGQQPGLWVFARLYPLTKEAQSINVQDFPMELNNDLSNEDDSLEGIYYID